MEHGPILGCEQTQRLLELALIVAQRNLGRRPRPIGRQFFESWRCWTLLSAVSTTGFVEPNRIDDSVSGDLSQIGHEILFSLTLELGKALERAAEHLLDHVTGAKAGGKPTSAPPKVQIEASVDKLLDPGIGPLKQPIGRLPVPQPCLLEQLGEARFVGHRIACGVYG